MRNLVVALIALVAFAQTAWSHGGSFGDGPRGHWKRGIPCTCAKVECKHCGTAALQEGKELARREIEVTELKRWGDIRRQRVTVTFESSRERGRIEAYARFEPAPVFAAFYGSLLNGESRLNASLQPSARARKTYLWERRNMSVDPLLLLRRGPGRLDVRVFPLAPAEPAVATIEGYAFVPPERPTSLVRVYRTGPRYLAVVPTGANVIRRFDDVEIAGHLLYFLDEEEVKRRFGLNRPRDVPCVQMLETAVTGNGKFAAGATNTLAAFAANAKLPPFVGPDVWVEGAVPPGMRGDAPPPPPPTHKDGVPPSGHVGGPVPPPPPSEDKERRDEAPAEQATR